MSSSDFDKSTLNTVHRYPNRATYDKHAVAAIVAEAKIAHVAWQDELQGLPQCLPMIAALEVIDQDNVFLYFHGHPSARFMKQMQEHGTRLVATFTIQDGYVLSLSHFNSSMNYRSATLHGYSCPFGSFAHEKGQELALKAEKMKLVVESVIPGHWEYARQPSESELKGTELVRMLVESGSAKVRDGPPKNEKEDEENTAITSTTWAGVVPVRKTAGKPVPIPDCKVDVPDHILAL